MHNRKDAQRMMDAGADTVALKGISQFYPGRKSYNLGERNTFQKHGSHID